MEIYTDLEQVLQDPSLVIITEEISTQKDLNKLYAEYSVLPRKQKRVSNYYSNEFLGHTVPEMYVLVKDRLKAESDSQKEWQPANDTLVISEPDLYYREESFNAGDTNICFILGHSGSGKSMMARTLEGEDIDHIELDDLLLTKDHFSIWRNTLTCSAASLPVRGKNTISAWKRETAFPGKNTKTVSLSTLSGLRWPMPDSTGKRNISLTGSGFISTLMTRLNLRIMRCSSRGRPS